MFFFFFRLTIGCLFKLIEDFALGTKTVIAFVQHHLHL